MNKIKKCYDFFNLDYDVNPEEVEEKRSAIVKSIKSHLGWNQTKIDKKIKKVNENADKIINFIAINGTNVLKKPKFEINLVSIIWQIVIFFGVIMLTFVAFRALL